MARGGHGPLSLTFVTRGDQRISCPNRPGARIPIYEIYAEDCYRLDWFLGPMLHQPLRVLDIGAHVGAFACRLAALAPYAQLHCYEPSATTADYLRRNIAANGLQDRIAVVQAAISSRSGHALLADNGAGSALNGLATGGSGDQVETESFDDVAARFGPIDVVKIDCEGGEYDAVLASSPASWASVRRLVLEYHSHERHGWPELREWFAAAGLQVVRTRAESPLQGTAWLSREAAAG
jgi:FkbM family methyltransferase